MDEEKHLILINGQDKTNSVASFQFRAGKYDVVYTTSPKVYSYQSSRVNTPSGMVPSGRSNGAQRTGKWCRFTAWMVHGHTASV